MNVLPVAIALLHLALPAVLGRAARKGWLRPEGVAACYDRGTVLLAVSAAVALIALPTPRHGGAIAAATEEAAEMAPGVLAAGALVAFALIRLRAGAVVLVAVCEEVLWRAAAPFGLLALPMPASMAWVVAGVGFAVLHAPGYGRRAVYLHAGTGACAAAVTLLVGLPVAAVLHIAYNLHVLAGRRLVPTALRPRRGPFARACDDVPPPRSTQW